MLLLISNSMLPTLRHGVTGTRVAGGKILYLTLHGISLLYADSQLSTGLVRRASVLGGLRKKKNMTN